MIWSETYNQTNQPSIKNINDFVKSSLLNKLCLLLENDYSVLPNIEYSRCSLQKGWNIKYKKGGKSLCTIYPMDGYFIVLVVIGAKDQMEADLVITNCSESIRNLYHNTPFSCGGKWLMIEVTENSVLEDAIRLIRIKVK